MAEAITWSLRSVKVKDLKEHPRNPRQISKDQMAQLQGLIQKFGLIDKPIINTDRMLIGGHQRLTALKKMGVKEVECWAPDRELSNEDIDHLCIGLNKATGFWDFDKLANEWEMDKLLEWGFTEDELFGAVQKAQNISLDESEKKDEEKPKKTKTCPSCGHEF
jgi:hypothetical protein